MRWRLQSIIKESIKWENKIALLVTVYNFDLIQEKTHLMRLPRTNIFPLFTDYFFRLNTMKTTLNAFTENKYFSTFHSLYFRLNTKKEKKNPHLMRLP